MATSAAVLKDVPREGGLYRWYVLGVLMLIYAMNFIDRQIVTILAPYLKADLDLTDAQMPFGADVVVVALEDYAPAATDYLSLAYRLARVQGTVILIRAYGAEPFARIQPATAWLKELTIRHFGNFFGNEPARGGRDRGDWQVTLDAIGRGVLAAPPPHTKLVPFSALKTAGDIGALFDGLPGSAAKIVVDMAG